MNFADELKELYNSCEIDNSYQNMTLHEFEVFLKEDFQDCLIRIARKYKSYDLHFKNIILAWNPKNLDVLVEMHSKVKALMLKSESLGIKYTCVASKAINNEASVTVTLTW